MSRDEQRFGKLSLTISKLVLFSRSAVHILIFFAFSIHQRMFIVFNTCRCRLSHSLWNVCIYQATGYSHVFTYIDRQPLYMMYTLYRIAGAENLWCFWWCRQLGTLASRMPFSHVELVNKKQNSQGYFEVEKNSSK
jgi:hypothetical protein